VDNATAEPPEQDDSDFAVDLARVLGGDDRVIEHRFSTIEVEAMLLDVSESLGFVPLDHGLNVYAKN
jgi:hypothetical protein